MQAHTERSLASALEQKRPVQSSSRLARRVIGSFGGAHVPGQVIKAVVQDGETLGPRVPL